MQHLAHQKPSMTAARTWMSELFEPLIKSLPLELNLTTLMFVSFLIPHRASFRPQPLALIPPNGIVAV